MTFEESQVNRDAGGRFDQKPQSQPEVSLGGAGRAARLEEAMRLRVQSSGRDVRPDERAAMNAEVKRLEARPTRKAPALQSLNLQPSTRSVMHFLPRAGEEDYLELNPPYQRGTVWQVEQRQALFYSLLRGVPVGAVTVNDRFRANRRASDAAYAVVDGKQRIETLRLFAADEFAIPADWMGDRDVLDEDAEGGVRWSGLSEVGRRRIQNLPLPTIEAAVPTIEEEAQLYLLINESGAEQTDADIRRAREFASPNPD